MTYSWDFPALHVARSVDGQSNVVTDVDWMLTARDGEGHSASLAGRVGMAGPDPDIFTDFDSLTREQVQAWVEAQMGDDLDVLKARLDAMVAEMADPPVAILTPPWAAPAQPEPEN
ncbi:DUF7936 family protein [Sphingobium cloacae]|uniref:DUF7936 domain-containing protein n=1 Tax=Sphingobium cloacae TaxID=120107 RepID=A0A1E1F2K8_9SPHN|nr:hypothetical protein [Sphingobium cloacae]BAV64759.1 hypothetical protein SCLO_1017190 [Sphingobium cloacae]